MAGATITVTDTVPALGKKLIFFTVTSDGSGDADFSAYTSVDWVSAVIVSSLVPSAASVYTAGGDIRFADSTTALAGVAIVT